MFVTAITCFHGRHSNVERVIRHYLDQDYTGQKTLLLYNNSPQEQVLCEELQRQDISLINNHIDLQTGKEYTNTGAIFRDALSFANKMSKIVTFFDSDDSFMPKHLSSGVEGMKKAYIADCLAYKPHHSYFLYENRCELMHNTLEPSIFVDYQYVKREGFNPVACSYHQKWLDKLKAENRILVDPEGTPTLLYNWEEGHGNHKISGMGDSEFNFEAHRKWETDYGDGILTPASRMEVEKYYTLAKATRHQTA